MVLVVHMPCISVLHDMACLPLQSTMRMCPQNRKCLRTHLSIDCETCCFFISFFFWACNQAFNFVSLLVTTTLPFQYLFTWEFFSVHCLFLSVLCVCNSVMLHFTLRMSSNLSPSIPSRNLVMVCLSCH